MKLTNSNQTRKKRSDTLLGSIEKQYNVSFGRRSDMKLGTYMQEKGFKSLGNTLNYLDKMSRE